MTQERKSKRCTDLFEIETIIDCLCIKPSKIEEKFAFGLFFNSVEDRSMEYRKLFNEKAIKYSKLVNFDPGKDGVGRKKKEENLCKNKEYLASISEYCDEPLNLPCIFDYEDNISRIISSIPQELFKVGANFFVDISGAPLIYTVALLRYFQRVFPSPTLYLLNVSGDYVNKKDGKPQFSSGKDKNTYVPGFYGETDHSLPFLYVFLLGYEGERSYNILKTDDPSFIDVIIAHPGYEGDNHHKSIKYNKDFLKETQYIDELKEVPENSSVDCIQTYGDFIYREIPGKEIYHIPVEKIDQVCDTILSIYENNKDKAEIRLVPLGTKSHAIGAGLAGLIESKISIMYQTPKAYSMDNVKAGEKMWVYKIKSL